MPVPQQAICRPGADRHRLARAIVGLALLAAPAARAAEPPVTEAPRSVVYLAADDARDPSQATARILAAQLSSLKVELVVAWVPTVPSDPDQQVAQAVRIGRARGALAVVWCRFEREIAVHLYHRRLRGGRLLTRTVGPEAGSEAGRLEIVGTIVQGGIDAILSGRTVGWRVSEPEPPPPPPPPRPAPRPRRRPGVEVIPVLEYVLGGVSDEVRVAHGARLSLEVSVHRLFTVGLGYGATPSLRPQAQDQVELTVHRHELRILGGLAWQRGRLRVGAQAAFELDLLQHRARAPAESPLDPMPDGVAVDAGLEGLLHIGVRVTRRLSLHAGVGALFLVRRTDFSVAEAARPLLVPWWVRPLGVVGIRVHLR